MTSRRLSRAWPLRFAQVLLRAPVVLRWSLAVSVAAVTGAVTVLFGSREEWS